MSQVSTQNVKSTLAKLLAGENISVQHKRVRTASFDVKNRVLTLPIYKTDISSDVYDTFVAHEVGHALWTPSDESVLRNKKLFPYVNLVEDIRIEKRIKNKFGGLVKSFVAGYNELWKEGFFGVTEDNIPDLSFADKLNINAKIGIPIDFTNEEEILVKKAKSCVTFAEVVKVAEEIRDYCKDEQDREEEQEESRNQKNPDKGKKKSSDEDESGSCDTGSESGDEDGNEESESGSGDEDGNEESESGSESGSGDGDEDGNEESESGSGDGDEDSDEESDYKKSKSGSDNSDKSESKSENGDDDFDESEILKTQKNFDSSVEDVVDHTAKDPLYMKLPEFDLSEIIVSSDEVLKSVRKARLDCKGAYDTDGRYNDFKKSNLNIVNHLLKQFEMKKAANLYKKASESKTGTIDVNKVYRYSYDDNIFKRNTVIPEGKNHGLVLFLDWSGSMSDKFNPTIQQTLNLVFFCKKAGIAFDVYGFTDRYRSDALDNKLLATGESNILTVSRSFKLIHLISSSQKGSTFNEAASNLYWLSYYYYKSEYGLGNTPLHSSLIVAPQIIRKFKEKNNLQVVHMVILTDGYPSDDFIRHTFIDSYGRACCTDTASSPTTFIVHKNKNYPTSKVDGYRHTASTIALLDFVKDVTGVTITGFFLTPETGSRVASEAFNRWKSGSSWDDKQKGAATFTYEKSLTISDCGFDEIHFISSKTKHLSTDGDSPFPDTAEEDVKKALKEVNKAFKKIGSERNKKRVVLNRFIELISKPKNIV